MACWWWSPSTEVGAGAILVQPLIIIWSMPQPENMAKTTKAKARTMNRAMPNPAHRTSCCSLLALFVIATNSIIKRITRMKQKQAKSALKKSNNARMADFPLPFIFFFFFFFFYGVSKWRQIMKWIWEKNGKEVVPVLFI